MSWIFLHDGQIQPLDHDSPALPWWIGPGWDDLVPWTEEEREAQLRARQQADADDDEPRP